MDYNVSVTKEDVEAAVRKSSSHCAIAAAIQAEIEGATYISVDIQTIRFSVGDTRYVFLTPRAAQKAILDFDQGHNPRPFNLKLRNPQTVSRNKKESAKLVKDRGRDRHVPRIAGGRTPPKASSRREFGLRAFDRNEI